MKKILNLKNKKITIMGLGLNRGGLGVARYLAESGADVLVTDLKKRYELQKSIDELEAYDITYVLGGHRAEDFIGRDMIIQNPGVPNHSKYLQIAREFGTPIETDLSLFLKVSASQNFIAVGGTKGKSTVTDLIYHIFCRAGKDIVYAGNIGISVFDVLPKIDEDTTVLLEISSWQLEGIQKLHFKPHVAVLTNILPDHLDRYDSFEEYARSEELIYKYMEKTDFLITSFDNPVTKNLAQQITAEVLWFSTNKIISQGSYLEDNKLIFKRAGKQLQFAKISDILIPGNHNISNILAAANVGFILGLSASDISGGIKDFSGVPNRLEKIRTLNGINFYNDTCATTPEAAAAAIHSFPNIPLILILGGKDKKLKYDYLCRMIIDSHNITHLVILRHPEYDASEIIIKKLEENIFQKKIHICQSMPEAVDKAYSLAKPGTNILLSPAATSFGLYINEFDRGNSFRQIVFELS